MTVTTRCQQINIQLDLSKFCPPFKVAEESSFSTICKITVYVQDSLYWIQFSCSFIWNLHKNMNQDTILPTLLAIVKTIRLYQMLITDVQLSWLLLSVNYTALVYIKDCTWTWSVSRIYAISAFSTRTSKSYLYVN